jgi:ABC-2 type transport system permease protein
MTATTVPVAAPAASRPAASPGAGLARASMAISRRSLIKFFRSPQLVVVSTLQGSMFLLIFRYVFGGAITTHGISYVDFLVPGFVATTVLFAGGGASVAVAEDLEAGLFDRLRSLPIPRAAVLCGRALADAAILVWSLAVTTAVGFVVGFRLHGSILEGVLAFAFCVLLGLVFEWMFILIGLLAGNPQAANGMGLLVFPLTFVSSAFVPVKTMPGWLQAFAEHQPITVMVDGVRALCLGDDKAQAVLGHHISYYLVYSVAWSVALIAVFLPLAVVRFNKS